MENLSSEAPAEGAGHPLAEAIEYLDHGLAVFGPAGSLVVANSQMLASCALETAPEADPKGRLDTLCGLLRRAIGRRATATVLERLEAAKAEQLTGLFSDVETDELPGGTHALKCFSHSDGSVTVTLRPLPPDHAPQHSTRTIFGDAMDKVNFGVALVDEKKRLVFANKKFRANCDPNDELLIPGHSMRQVHGGAIRTGLFPLPDGGTEEALLDHFDRLIASNARDFPVPNTYGAALIGNVYGTEMGGHILTIQDLTEDRHAEKLLLNAMDRLPVGVAIENAEGQFTHCNAAYTEPYGLEPKDLMAMPGPERIAYLAPQLASIDNIASFDDIGLAFRDAIQRQRETLQPFEVRFKSGRQYLVERAKTENNGRVLVVTDITALKDAETRNLAAVTDAVQSLDIGVVLFDKDFKITFSNDRWAEIFASDEAPARQGDHAMDALRRQVEAGLYKLPPGMSDADFVLRTSQMIENYAKNEPLVFSDGRCVLASCHQTRLDGYLLSFVDITEQRSIERELENQRELIRQKERLSALGELLASVAHELNNPLSIIVGYAHMLADKIDDPVNLRRITKISEAANRSTKIVEMFLDMARERPFETAPCDLNDIVNSALEIAKSGLAEETQVELALDQNLGPIAADADQLIQVAYNIIVNAQHAMQNSTAPGRLRLRTHQAASTETAVIEISDNGPGIPPELRSRVFEPLFSTKDVGEGTGMGLALCHRIVTGHDGSITIGDSDLGGARFVIRLPRVRSATHENVEN